jgi:hypothetical protein
MIYIRNGFWFRRSWWFHRSKPSHTSRIWWRCRCDTVTHCYLQERINVWGQKLLFLTVACRTHQSNCLLMWFTLYQQDQWDSSVIKQEQGAEVMLQDNSICFDGWVWCFRCNCSLLTRPHEAQLMTNLPVDGAQCVIYFQVCLQKIWSNYKWLHHIVNVIIWWG